MLECQDVLRSRACCVLTAVRELQVYVFCCAHAEQVRQHLQDAEWTKEGASMDVQVNPF